MVLADYTDEEILAEAKRRQKRISEERRKTKDRERYLRNREERMSYQRDYYYINRDDILKRKHEKYQEIRCQLR